MNKQFARLPSTAPLDLVQFFLFFLTPVLRLIVSAGRPTNMAALSSPSPATMSELEKKNSKEKERKQFTHASPREEQVLYFTLFSWLFLSPAPVK